MSENVCCPMLNVIECGETDEHKHLLCESKCIIDTLMIDNDQVKSFCMADVVECKYYPKEG
mgnify:FL=1